VGVDGLDRVNETRLAPRYAGRYEMRLSRGY
jgi:hypothetical protein